MPPTDKRARKKAIRDERIEQQWAAYRRRRNARIGAVVAALLAIVVLALFVGGGEDDRPGQQAADQPEEEGTVACGGETPPPADPKQYEEPPELTVPAGTDYAAVIHTSCGDIEMDLLEEDSPKTVANFVFLSREGFFDGLIWHRIERDFVIQTGDPNGQNGTPPDGAGFSIPDELPKKDNQYVLGVVAMANSGPGTSSSQFFIITHDLEAGVAGTEPQPAGLDAAYSIFGMVDESSYEVLDLIRSLELNGGDDPVEAVKPVLPVYIESIEILER